MKKSKYGNKKTMFAGYEFDSGDEAKFYMSLRHLYPKSDIKLQPKFELQPKFKNHNENIRAIHYVGDFQMGNYVFDVKGVYTDVFKLKEKLFKFKHPELILLTGTSNELLGLLKGIKL